MRIIEWNCQGAFRLKNQEIFELEPDILVIPECESEEKLQFGKLTPKPNDFFWYGNAGKKGIGIFSYSKFTFKLLKEFNPDFRYVIPLEVSDGKNSFLLFAIWAMDNKLNPLTRYIGQIWLAINYYQATLKYNSILIGDFNSNQIWNKNVRDGNHTQVVDFLAKLNIDSLYHMQLNEEQGQESIYTFYLYRNLERPYHIDYIFASNNLVKNGYNLSFENVDSWINKSDHIPLVLDINELESKTDIPNTYLDFTKRHLSHIRTETIERYRKEIDEIIGLAKQLDLNQPSNPDKLLLIDKLETIKKINILTSKLT